MPNLTPSAALQLLGHIGQLNWRGFDRADYDAFADAGPDARIAEVSGNRSAWICELLGLRRSDGLLAIIGGDALQIEFHGVDDQGDCIAVVLPLAIHLD